MYFVYIIKSINFPELVYVGSTSNVEARIKTHNNGGSIYTKNYKPWDLVWYCAYKDKEMALNFEQYLKSHSGKAFLNKRLI